MQSRKKLCLSSFWLVVFIFSGAMQVSFSQVIANLTVHDVKNQIGIPINVDLDNLTYLPDSLINLVMVDHGRKISVPFQIEHGQSRKIWWMVRKEGNSRDLKFELLKSEKTQYVPVVNYKVDDGKFVITEYGKDVLQYNFKTVYPPEGVDSVFKRSGFIHPLWSPDGTVLTRINPWDHRHHFGIWDPWTHVRFRGKNVDFWNLGQKLGTVRFAKFIDKISGPVFGGYKVLQEHVAFDSVSGRKQDVVALNEVQNVKVYNVGPDMWLWDFTSILNCATNDSVILEKYDYGGGFSFRATQEWSGKNSDAITSAGKTRADGNKTRADWCKIEGKSAGGTSGILFMSSPGNYNSPQPIRLYRQDWLNGSGDLFFCFTPTLTTDWKLLPGNNYSQNYRTLVYSGKISKEQAEAFWEGYAHPPKISVQKVLR